MSTDAFISTKAPQMADLARRGAPREATDPMREQTVRDYKEFVDKVNRATDSDMAQSLLRHFAR
ncbi:hypothetical protein [Mesorhizobium sp. LjNodule214]|uniref:hypothetical protein n=1 Tax=Mesorhizobium sp. LjNodule214 TaxID=3342252 RepID=UPI003ECD7E12